MSEVTRRDAVKLAAAAGVAAFGATTALAADEQANQRTVGEAEQIRGSTKMLEQLAGKKTGIDMAELRKLVEALDQQGVVIQDWWIFGTPRIDVVLGRTQIPVKQVDNLVKGVFLVNDFQHLRPNLDCFPYGIPSITNLGVGLRIQGS
jgi:hypothetical protein